MWLHLEFRFPHTAGKPGGGLEPELEHTQHSKQRTLQGKTEGAGQPRASPCEEEGDLPCTLSQLINKEGHRTNKLPVGLCLPSL